MPGIIKMLEKDCSFQYSKTSLEKKYVFINISQYLIAIYLMGSIPKITFYLTLFFWYCLFHFIFIEVIIDI